MQPLLSFLISHLSRRMEKELLLLERVELKFALADSLQALSPLLKSFLAPVVLKLDSPHPAVKQKVLKICSHVNARVKSNDCALPVTEMVALFQSGCGHAAKSFALIYIEMGIFRLPFLVTLCNAGGR